MNTTDIVSLLCSNKSTKKDFVGCFPVDRLPEFDRLRKRRFSLVVNLDMSTGPGSHWCAVYYKNKNMFYFDSFGEAPASPFLKKWFKNWVNKVYYNNIRHQKYTSLRCGGFCCWFIYEMSEGKEFSSLISFLESIDFDDDFIKYFMKSIFKFDLI